MKGGSLLAKNEPFLHRQPPKWDLSLKREKTLFVYLLFFCRNLRRDSFPCFFISEYADDYFVKLKALIESTYMKNKMKRMILVSQSMGCPYTLVFLKRQTQNWIDKYLATWITISGPWGGAVKALRAYISGDSFGIPPLIDSPILLRPAQRTYTSIAFIRPINGFWKDDEVVMKYQS